MRSERLGLLKEAITCISVFKAQFISGRFKMVSRSSEKPICHMRSTRLSAVPPALSLKQPVSTRSKKPIRASRDLTLNWGWGGEGEEWEEGGSRREWGVDWGRLGLGGGVEGGLEGGGGEVRRRLM